ncbi:DUF2490 domain-containing protein [Mesonia sp. K7]|uniref:DUF2490 domain-containing protein n=1 Tax=Mesonia sp. K7 TaxID=2218606 RepID=UPI000DA81B8D|nr:DUF2490 domain-containing protein [Mesonia sp. K7]PZD77846.1 DUF2490 domain-containing protein [Mesonia sp. K7]
MKIQFRFLLLLALFCSISFQAKAQVDEDKLGAWYMYFFDTTFGESNFGVQGDIQYRNWNLIGDLEQLLLRGGFTYKPTNSNIKFTLGYAHITTGAFGEDNSNTSNESRIYQEILFPTKVGSRFYFNHRLRYEQRFVENQDFRTRYRYNLFLNIPLNNSSLSAKTVYLALYDEIFINGQREIGNGAEVEIFDRNRFYAAFGYLIKDGLKVQLGVMRQSTDNWSKNQLQLSLHHSF